MNTLILIPSALELKQLLPGIDMSGPLPIYHEGCRSWGLCGVGPAAAAMSTSLYLTRHQPDHVLLAGIAGAFPNSGLALESVVQIRSECFADLGYQEDQTYVTLDHMHLPMMQGPNGDLGCRYPLAVWDEASPAHDAVTVSTVTSSQNRALQLAQQFGAAIENMEGSAAAAACAFHGAPFSQIRAVSNVVGPRDPKTWRITPALANLRLYLDTICPAGGSKFRP